MAGRFALPLAFFSAVLAALSSYFALTGCYLLFDGYTVPTLMFEGIGLVAIIISSVCLDMIRLEPADSHTAQTLMAQYFGHRVLPLLGLYAWRPMRKGFKNCKQAQEEVLKWILKENEDTAYSHDYQLGAIKSREEYVAQHPLTTYSRYEEYAERIAKGERNVLTKADVIYLGLTSGTTGKNKMYPVTTSNTKRVGQAYVYARLRTRQLFKNAGLKRNFQFRIFHPQTRSEGGILMGGIGQLYAVVKSECNIVPDEVLEIHQEAPSFYVQAIFVLSERELGKIDGFSSDLMYAFFNFMVLHKEEVCESLETGIIGAFAGLDDNIRWKLSAALKADTARATQVRAELEGSKVGLALRLWPRLAYCVCAKTGGFANCASLLAKSYLKDVPMGFLFYGGTEGCVGMVMNVEDTEEYTMLTNSQFMEFIPVKHIEEEQPQTLFMEQLQLGERYEVVVTNVSGLYRNRFGDVIEVTGFEESTPKFKFCYRTGQILTVAYDRTPEKALYEAITSAAKRWEGIEIANYTSTESFHMEEISGDVISPGCYIIFLEMTGDRDDITLTQEHADNIEASLRESHETYEEYRHQGSVGPLRLIQVRAGCFDAVRAAIFGDNVNIQFKLPRVQRKPAILRVLWDHRLI